MNETSRYPQSFLDYLPEPPMGNLEYRRKLEISYASDEANIHPIYTLLKVTERCNSHCVYCGHGTVKENVDLSTLQLTNVINQLAQVGTTSVNLSGGEPLLRDDLPELVRHAKSRSLFPVLLTNGLLLEKRQAELRGTGLGMVIVSIDSISAEAYQATRGVPLAPVLEGIDALLAWPDEERPVVSVTSVVTGNNIAELEQLVDYFGSRGIGVKFTPYHHHGRWEDDRLSPTDLLVYRQTIERLQEVKRDGRGVLNSHAYLDGFSRFSSRERKLPKGYRCYCGYTTLFIDSKLNVRSCWSQGLPVAGNLHEQLLADIIDGPRMRIMRGRIRQLRCERCWLLCTAEISLRFQ
ncbi:MAG: radical SAM protein [Desulfuromonadaceae bacterium]